MIVETIIRRIIVCMIFALTDGGFAALSEAKCIGKPPVKTIFLPVAMRMHPMLMGTQSDASRCVISMNTTSPYSISVDAVLRKKGALDAKRIQYNFTYPEGTKLAGRSGEIRLQSTSEGQRAELSYDLGNHGEVSNFHFRLNDEVIDCSRLRYFGDDC